MEIQFSPTNNVNLIQRNIKTSKKIKIKSKRYLNKDKLKGQSTKFHRTCKQVVF